ncbi:MMPL family transporter [Endothiovibrio diazotrophicus]
MDTKIARLASALVRWRWLTTLLVVGLVFGIAGGGRFIAFAADYEVWFAEDNPQLASFKQLRDTYAKSDNVIILLTPQSGDVFSRETLAAVEWLTAQAWRMPYSVRVDSVTNFQATYAREDDLVVEDLVRDAETLDTGQLARVRQIALSEPLLVNNLVSADARVTAVNVTINLPKDMPEGSPTVAAYARDLLRQLHDSHPELESHLTGLVMADNAFIEASQQDMGTLIPLMFGIILLGLVVALRSLSATLTILVTIVLAMVATMGFSGWIGVKLTPVSAGAPTIVMTVVVAHAVHLLISMIHAMRAGLAKREAIVESLRINLGPIFIATVTTIIGFLSLHFAEIPPFHDLGNMVALGVAVAFLLSLSLLPACISLLPLRVKPTGPERRRSLLKLADFVIRRRTALLMGLGALTVAASVSIANNEVTESTWKYFDESTAFRVDTDYASEHLVGPYFLEYSLETGLENGISQPQYLRQLEQFKDWLLIQPEVVHVNSISDILKRLNRNLHGDDAAWHRLPQDKELAAQYLLLYEMSLPYGLDLTNQVNLDKSATRVVVSLHNLSSKDMLAFERRVAAWLQHELPDLDVVVGSPMFMFANLAQRSVGNMAISLTFALVLISLLFMLSLRSVKVGLLSLVPNLLPPVIAFGLWGLFVGQVGLSLVVGVSMTIGIIVDDTVHFLSKYLRGKREQSLSTPEAVRFAFSHVGFALVVTTLVLIAGFLVLASSSFKQNVDLGVITALTIGIALIFDLLLLPALLLVTDGAAQRQAEEPAQSVKVIAEPTLEGGTVS